MNFHPQILFYAALFIVLGWCALAFFRKSSLSSSRRVALQWIATMDLRVDGERYQGERTTVIREIEFGRIGFVGFSLTVACHTKSGRPFLLEVKTTFNLVTAWELIPLSIEDMVEQLDALQIPVPLALQERKAREERRAAAAASRGDPASGNSSQAGTGPSRGPRLPIPGASSPVAEAKAIQDSDFSFDLGDPQDDHPR